MKSYAQAGQDVFVRLLHPEPGVFLDVGAAGLSISNTLALEEAGWTGALVDISHEALRASSGRKAKFICDDATKIDYSFLPSEVGYLSVDCDQYSLAALERVFETALGVRFAVITAEHDYHTRDQTLRVPMLWLLRNRGYEILCTDVCHDGCPFEAWAIAPELVDMAVAAKFRHYEPTDWKEILGL
jgi:hypothetical protein